MRVLTPRSLVLWLVGAVVACFVVLAFVPAAHGVPLVVAIVLSVVIVLGLVQVRRLGRDEQYAGSVPGELPLAGDPVTIRRGEVTGGAVRFEPPKGVPARLAGAIIRERSAAADVTATLVGLAVKGWVRLARDGRNVRLTPLTGTTPLDAVEQQLYTALFRIPRRSADAVAAATVSTASPEVRTALRELQGVVAAEYAAQKWYRRNPDTVVAQTRGGGAAIAILGTVAILGVGGALVPRGILGLGWLVVPCLILGIGLMLVAKRMPVRTPLGSVVAVQSYGFKRYLQTAEAKQIAWEERQNIFSTYLPYAIAYGCADHWAKVFKDLIATGAIDATALDWLSVADLAVDGLDLLGGLIEILFDGDALSALLDVAGGLGEIIGGLFDGL